MNDPCSPSPAETSQQLPAQIAWRAGGVSVIVPVAPGDSAWTKLLPDLAGLSREDEILVVGTEPEPGNFRQAVTDSGLCAAARWVVAPRGRAVQMNQGAGAAGGRWLWFLHADSRIRPAAIEELKQAIHAHPDALHYFNLRFLRDGPAGMRVNEAGVWFRSRWLKMPFGDQGFCLRRELFESLGGYAETAAYGEDHLLVWTARRQGIALRGTDSAIETSARKYRAGGWLRTTARHLVLTFAQASPQALLLLHGRIRGLVPFRRPGGGRTGIPSQISPPERTDSG